MKYKRKLLALIITSIFLIIFTGCSDTSEKGQENNNTSKSTTDDVKESENVNISNIPTDVVRGNTNANLVNNGKVAVQGDWLYFSGNDGLYKSKIDGSQQQKLANGYQNQDIYWINVIDDWVYFASLGLYKVKTDGSEFQQIDT